MDRSSGRQIDDLLSYCDFVDDTGNDVLIANIMGKDKGDAFTKVLLNKIGVSPEVLLICINAYTKNRK